MKGRVSFERGDTCSSCHCGQRATCLQAFLSFFLPLSIPSLRLFAFLSNTGSTDTQDTCTQDTHTYTHTHTRTHTHTHTDRHTGHMRTGHTHTHTHTHT